MGYRYPNPDIGGNSISRTRPENKLSDLALHRIIKNPDIVKQDGSGGQLQVGAAQFGVAPRGFLLAVVAEQGTRGAVFASSASRFALYYYFASSALVFE